MLRTLARYAFLGEAVDAYAFEANAADAETFETIRKALALCIEVMQAI